MASMMISISYPILFVKLMMKTRDVQAKQPHCRQGSMPTHQPNAHTNPLTLTNQIASARAVAPLMHAVAHAAANEEHALEVARDNAAAAAAAADHTIKLNLGNSLMRNFDPIRSIYVRIHYCIF